MSTTEKNSIYIPAKRIKLTEKSIPVLELILGHRLTINVEDDILEVIKKIREEK